MINNGNNLWGMDMKRKRVALIIVLAAIMLMMTGCVPGDGTYSIKPAGFFSGIWHGWLAPLTLIISIFDKNINIYEVINTGWWYDFGFYAAIISGFGGLSLSRKKKHCKKD